MERDVKRYESETIGKLLLEFSVPSVISLVLNAFYNMVDQIFIGNGVGYLGNGATNVIFPLTQLAIAIGLLIGDGTASYMNLKLGEGKKEQAEKGMAAGLSALVISGLFLSIVLTIFLPQLCSMFGATKDIMPYALDYGYIIVGGTLCNIFPCGAMSIVRGNGGPKVAMESMLTGFTINMIGDPLTIYVFHWGVKGAALATVMGQIGSAIVCIVWLAKKKGTIQLSKQSFEHCLPYVKDDARHGLSSFVTQVAIVIVLYFQNNLLVKYGAMSKYGAEIPLTALGVTMKVFTILQNAITGLCSGAQPIISYNYGRGLNTRVRKILKTLLVISGGLMLAATIWFQLAPMSIVRIFGSTNDLYNEFSVKCLRIYLMLIFLDNFQMVGSSFLQSIGKSVTATMLILFRQIIVLIPAMLILGKIYGVDGLLYA
ncbi:MAG: MATE family efflux transporter [Lactimicrobium sp.]|jgi:putative MATE family efflux protein|uniref:MATE family efflux transporter n=1 Tax=Lactimicrobium sp. TaxID=2563780 RepID=UPI002F351DBD